MTLKVFDPGDNELSVVMPDHDKQIGERLLNTCVEEIKQSRMSAQKPPADDSPLAAAIATAEELRWQLGAKVNLKDYQSGQAILDATPRQQVAVVLSAMTSLVKQRFSEPVLDRMCDACLKSLLRRKLPYDDADINRMLTLVIADSMVYTRLPLPSIVSNIERCTEQDGMSKSVRRKLEKLTTTYYPEAYSANERKIGVRIQAVLEKALPEPGTNRTPKNVPPKSAENESGSQPKPFHINTGEAWTNALLVELGKLTDDARANWHQLLDHCGSAKSSKPTGKWSKQTRGLLEPIGETEFIRVIDPALAAIGQPGECQKFNRGGYIHFGHETEVHDTHADLLRGLVWATSMFDNETLVGRVGDAAETCFQKIREVGPRCPKVGNACLFALSSLGTESAVAQLGRLKSRAKHVSTRKQIARAFERAAATAGMTEDDLIELAVPKFGLTETGTYVEQLGDFTAELVLHANRKTELRWIKPSGGLQKSVPAAVKSEYADQLKALKKKVKDIDTLMPSIRARIEQLVWKVRCWPIADFRNRFLDHPVVGVVARHLIWNLQLDDKTTPVVWQGNQFAKADNLPFEMIDEQTQVTLWHPMQSTPEEVLQWRNWLEEHQVSQPFKQAHREVYILTDAEHETAAYSNRFAAHIIRQHQFASLCQQRGWRFDLQGDWDSWNAPYLDLPQHGLRVEFFVAPLDGLNEVTPNFIYTHLSTGQVRFLRLDNETQVNLLQPIALTEVDPLVFSEAMRDVDLFVGVCSVGNDPNWHEQGAAEPYTDYWQQFSFGQLSQTAMTRKQTLESAVPNLKIAEKLRIEDRFLVVQGKLRSYKIHLGSGNVLMSPNDQYLCIVQKRGSGAQRTDNIFLPFEGDNTLSLILSKAFLLAEDDKIKDQTIVNQIRLDRD